LSGPTHNERMNGSLSQISFADILRELHLTRRTGLLRLTHEKTLRAIFVEQGKLVFALSNVADERLGEFLLARNAVTRAQYDQIMLHPNGKQRFGAVAVELGFLSQSVADDLTKRQITEIILSAFAANSGEFSFEENARAAHDVKLDLLTPNIILMGVRAISNEATLRAALGPTSQQIGLSPDAETQLRQATLDGSEGFVLSRITHPLTIDDLIVMSGVPETMIIRVVFGLLSAGILTSDVSRPTMANPVLSAAPAAPASLPTPTALPDDDIPTEADARAELQTLLEFLSIKSTTYYDTLNVAPAASESDIKKSYYQLAKKYHPDRFRRYGTADVVEMAEQIFARIGTAYEKLKDPDVRQRYNAYIGFVPSPPSPSPSPGVPVSDVSPDTPSAVRRPPTERIAPVAPPDTPSAVRRPPTERIAPVAPPVATTGATEPLRSSGSTPASQPPDPQETATRSYQLGCNALEQKEYLTAATYFREAVKHMPDVIAYRMRLAQLCAHTPKLRKEAEEHLLHVLKIEPRNVDAMLALAQLYRAGGMEKSAQAQYEAVIAIQPGNPVAREALAAKAAKSPAKSDAKSPAKPEPPEKPSPKAKEKEKGGKKDAEKPKSIFQQDVGELLGKLFRK
jgi:tetratricopeptide (TPR) repeat protein